MQESHYYKLLELQPGASQAEVKAAYRKLVKRYHPDLSGLKSSSVQFNEIVAAYQKLQLNLRTLKVTPQPARRQTASRGSQPHPAHEAEHPGFISLARFGKIMLSSAQPGLRRNAAISLGRSGKKSAYGFLRRGLWDDEPEVVLAVVKAITNLKISQAGGELGALFLKTTRQIKLAILDLALVMRQYPAFEYILLLGLRDADQIVKNFVLIEKTGRAEA